MSDQLCVCGCPRSSHDQQRCDKRCKVHEDCTHFRLSAHQPGEVLVHRHGHGAKPGKGMPAMWDVKDTQ